MLRIALVDLGMGNLRSVERAISHAAADRGIDVNIARSVRPEDVLSADKVIVPGQGAFRDCAIAMGRGMGDALRQTIQKGTPYLGICLGLQVLFDSSDESPGSAGLGIFPGHVARLNSGAGEHAVKIPHMGWNQLEMVRPGEGFLGVWQNDSPYVYFVHSYHAVADDESVVVATVTHGCNRVTAAITRDNVTAVQFHPEKSQRAGLELLGAFVAS